MTYNSYYGNAMNMSGSYCIHYGRKGMKWYQNIFAAPQDLVRSVRSSYRGARDADNALHATASHIPGSASSQYLRSKGNGYASYGTMYGASNRHAQQIASDANDDRAGYNRTISTVGNAIGVTAYNTTKFVKRVGEKVGQAAATAWNYVKTTGAKVLNKGKEILGNIIGWGKNAYQSIFGGKKQEAGRDQNGNETYKGQNGNETYKGQYGYKNKIDKYSAQKRFDGGYSRETSRAITQETRIKAMKRSKDAASKQPKLDVSRSARSAASQQMAITKMKGSKKKF